MVIKRIRSYIEKRSEVSKQRGQHIISSVFIAFILGLFILGNVTDATGTEDTKPPQITRVSPSGR